MHQNHVHFSTVTNDELKKLNKTWERGPFRFLLQRTIENYNKLKTVERRHDIELSLNMKLPPINDDLLQKLYNKVSTIYDEKLSGKDKLNEFNKRQKLKPTNEKPPELKVNSGFYLTACEVGFMNSFQKLKDQIPKLKNVELVPFAKTTRMPIGPYLPDFLLLGLSMKGTSLLAIEINGGIHNLKISKDFAKEDDLLKFGISTINIQNNEVSDLEYLSKIFNDSKIINLKNRTPEQVQTILRRIWVKTIVNHWPLERIEMELNMESGFKFNLIKEFHELVKHSKCPRSIKDEYKKIY